MSSKQFETVLIHAIVPRAGRLPADIGQLLTANEVGLVTCRRTSTSDFVREDAIRTMIADALAGK